MEIDCHSKTGFQTNDKIVRIYDDAGVLFYFRNPVKVPFYFNLPKGKYKTTNKIVKQSQPRKFKLPKLPTRERSGEIPKHIKWTWGRNPHKASIFRHKNTVLLDYGIKNLSRSQRVQVKLHELGHYYYQTEHYCDLFAAREMLKMGYNPSQIYWGQKGTLSDSPIGIERKEFILKHCEQA